jgi:predicted transcriptional regulator
MLTTHAGGSVYSNSEFDLFTGRLVTEYTVTKPLRNGGLLCKHVQVIDVGRSDPVTPVDPDGNLHRERLPAHIIRSSTQEMINATNASHDKARIERHAQLVAIIQEQGPVTLIKAGQLLNCQAKTIQDTIAVLDGIVVIGRTYPGGIWLGFEGQAPPDIQRPRAPSVQRVYDCIHEHGPLSISDIAKRTGLDYGTVKTAFMRHRDMFCKLLRPRRDKFHPTFLAYGIVGIHDQEATP